MLSYVEKGWHANAEVFSPTFPEDGRLNLEKNWKTEGLRATTSTCALPLRTQILQVMLQYTLLPLLKKI